MKIVGRKPAIGSSELTNAIIHFKERVTTNSDDGNKTKYTYLYYYVFFYKYILVNNYYDYTVQTACLKVAITQCYNL